MSDTAPADTPPPPLSPIPGSPGLLARVRGGRPGVVTNNARRNAVRGRSLSSRWMVLVRPQMLLLGLAPTVATMMLLWSTGTHLLAVPTVFSVIAVALVQSGAHLLDEYLEFERFQRAGAVAGVLSAGDPGALLGSSGIAPLTVLRASIGLLIAGGVAGMPLVATGGEAVAVLGVCGLGIAFLYSATTYALKRLRGGELIVFSALGPGIAVTVALAEHARVSGAVLLTGCALGLLALSVVIASQVSGLDRDKRMGHQALVGFIGLDVGRLLYVACLVLAFVFMALLALPRGTPHGALAVLLALPMAAVALSGMLLAGTPSARALLPRQAFRIYALFALWLVVGLFATGIVTQIVMITFGGA